MIEVWKIPSSFPCVEVSNLGNVRRVETKKAVKQHKNNRGYCQMHISMEGKVKTKYAHRLIVEAFICPVFEVVDHIDGNKANNHLNNLRPCNRRQNQNYFYKNPLPGAYYEKSTKKWVSCITVKNKTVTLGRFDSQNEASAAYVAYAKKLGDKIN